MKLEQFPAYWKGLFFCWFCCCHRLGPRSLCWWLWWYPCLADRPSGSFVSDPKWFGCCCCCRGAKAAVSLWSWSFCSFCTPNFWPFWCHGESLLAGPIPIWRPQCTNLMVIGQENALGCLWKHPKSRDILVQTDVAWEAKWTLLCPVFSKLVDQLPLDGF